MKLVHVDLVEVELALAVPHEDSDVVPLPQPRVVPQSAGQVSLGKEESFHVNSEQVNTYTAGQ